MAESIPRFLFAVLQIDRICVARTIKKIKLALESMPKELDELYRQTVERIRRQPGDDGVLGMKVLSWVTHAKRPLGVEEIQHALAVEVDEDEDSSHQMDFDNILSPQSLTDLCAGLVVIDPCSQIIRLVHYTTQEFFDRERQGLFADTEHEISRVCLTYLLYDVASVLSTDDYISETLLSYPFFGYAALYWPSHLRSIKDYNMRWQSLLEDWEGDVRPARTFADLCDDDHRVTFEKVEAYINDTDKLLFSTMVLRKLILRPSAYGRISEVDLQSRRQALPLEAASECGLLDLTQLILTQSRVTWGPNPSNAAALNTAMIQASSAGHTSIVRLLLSKRIFARDATYDLVTIAPALHAACKNGHVAAAELLVNSGVNPGIGDQWNWKPLHYAAYGGYADLVAFLLQEGAYRFAQTPLGLTACHIAAERGHLDVVVLLLQNTVSSQWPTTLKKNTVIHSAAGAGHLNIINLLLSKGFDPWTKNGSGRNARELVPNNESKLVEAAFSGYTELSFKSQTAVNSSTNAIPETSGSHDEKSTTDRDELDAIQADDSTTTPAVRLVLIAPTPEASVAGSSDKGSTRSPSPETPAIVINEGEKDESITS